MTRQRGKDNRDFDQTALHSSGHGRNLHRDYTAHFFRWSFARRFINQTDKVLEVGCGGETPLFRVLAANKSTYPTRYVGVDLNKFKHPKAKWAKFYSEFNFIEDYKKLPKFNDVIIHFEVIEHMQVKHGRQLLKGCHALLKKGGTMLMSTPVYNGKWQAKNHIHEYEIEELRQEVEKAGFQVVRRFGTFMNKQEVTKKASIVDPAHRAVYDELEAYYDNDALACFLAPLYPDLARNNLWVCRKK